LIVDTSRFSGHDMSQPFEHDDFERVRDSVDGCVVKVLLEDPESVEYEVIVGDIIDALDTLVQMARHNELREMNESHLC